MGVNAPFKVSKMVIQNEPSLRRRRSQAIDISYIPGYCGLRWALFSHDGAGFTVDVAGRSVVYTIAGGTLLTLQPYIQANLTALVASTIGLNPALEMLLQVATTVMVTGILYPIDVYGQRESFKLVGLGDTEGHLVSGYC